MKPTATKVATRRPIADQLIRKIRGYVGAKDVDLSAVREGSKNAEALQKTVESRETLADHHPAHAIYIDRTKCARRARRSMATARRSE